MKSREKVGAFGQQNRGHQSELSNGFRDCTKMLLRDLLDLRFGQCGEIGRLGGDDSLKRLRMMGLQILIQEIDGAAFARSMADQDDRFGMY